MAWKLGSDLSPADQQRVKAMYVHRSTGDHPGPSVVKGKPYPVLFRSDNEWLAHTRFRITGKGRLDGRARHCWSSPTMAMLTLPEGRRTEAAE